MPHDRNYLRAYTLARIRTRYICTFYCWPFSEWQVDTTKEFLLQICEAEVDRMPVSDKENEKIHLKKWFSATAQGIKDEFRADGRLLR